MIVFTLFLLGHLLLQSLEGYTKGICLRPRREQLLLGTGQGCALVLSFGTLGLDLRDQLLLPLLHLNEAQVQVGHLLLGRLSCGRHLSLPRGRGRRHGWAAAPESPRILSSADALLPSETPIWDQTKLPTEQTQLILS